MEPTCAIITMVKYEHDFINQWIEYHLKIGFSHFYILIDNLGIRRQSDYQIEEKFKQYVTLIDCTQDTLVKHWGNSLPAWHHSGFVHNLLNHEIIDTNIITQDWVAAIGIDQFMYLNGTPVPDFLKTIEESCAQIIIPWTLAIYNNKNHKHDNLMENIDSYTCQYNSMVGHSNGFIRTSNLEAINGNSHSFISKTNEQSIFIVDEYFTMPKELETWDVFDIACNKLKKKSLNEISISSFHFIIRNVLEVFIKSFFVWGCANVGMNPLIPNIRSNTIDLNLICRMHNLNNEGNISNLNNEGINTSNYNIVYPKLEIMNSDSQYKSIIDEDLEKCNISVEEFNCWINENMLFPITTNKNGEKFFGIENDGIFELIKKYGYFSPLEIIFLQSLISEEDNVIEIGTNIGSHTIPLSKMNPHGRFICFEPQEYIFNILQKNITINKRDNVIPLNYAIGEKNTTIYHNTKIIHENNSGAFTLYQIDSSTDPTDKQFKIEIRNLNDIIEISDLQNLKLIKMDVELMEYEILVNIKELLRKHLPILFIEFSPETLKDIYYLLRELGYKIFWFITVNEQYDLFLNYNYNVSQFTQGDINIVCFPNSYIDIPSFLEEVQEQEIQEIQHSFTHFIDPRNIFPSSTV
jgi:FkbM family methyltransferase